MEKENFRIEILEFCSKENLHQREEFWIKELDAVNKGYNLTSYSKGFKGGELHPNYGISSWNKGLPKEQQPFYKKEQPQSMKEKLSNERMGKNNPIHKHKFSDEERDKMGKRLQENLKERKENGTYVPSNIGKEFSNETKLKMSKNNCRYWEGKLTVNSKVTYRIDNITGEILEKFNSASSASKKFKGAIRRCAKELKGTAGGFIWLYEEDLDKIELVLSRNKRI